MTIAHDTFDLTLQGALLCVGLCTATPRTGPTPRDMFKLVLVGPHCKGTPPLFRPDKFRHYEARMGGRAVSYWNAFLLSRLLLLLSQKNVAGNILNVCQYGKKHFINTEQS